ncbi:hypothetical protein EMG21_29920 [Klebsiella pneumoniae]|nr:hypothetical protein EMG21_29920 [Klebsiella pneumoniae]
MDKKLSKEIFSLFKPSIYLVVPFWLFLLVAISFSPVPQNLGDAILFIVAYLVVAMVAAVIGSILFQIMFWVIIHSLRLLMSFVQR